jgi:hypothetical protein
VHPCRPDREGDDDEDDARYLGQLLSSPVGGGGPLGRLVKRCGRTALTVVAVLLGLAALIAIAVNARSGAVDEGIANPDVTGAPRPVEPLFGFDHWVALHQIGTVLMMVALVTGFVLTWRRYPRHPILLMVLVTTILIWQDPIMNWAPYAVHWRVPKATREGPGRRDRRGPPSTGLAYCPTSRVTMLAGSVAVVAAKNGMKALPFCPRPT